MASILTPITTAIPISSRTKESTVSLTGGGADVTLTLTTGSIAVFLAIQDVGAASDPRIFVRTTSGGANTGIPLRLDSGSSAGADRVMISIDWAEPTPVTIEVQPFSTTVSLNIVELF